MIEWLKNQWNMWQVGRYMRRADRRHKREVREAKKQGKSEDEIRSIQEDYFAECAIDQDELNAIESRHLVRKAIEYHIPLPASGNKEAWQRSPLDASSRYLTPKAMAELRSAVRKEQNERWQFWELRLKVITALLAGVTGAIGALIGLFATLKH